MRVAALSATLLAFASSVLAQTAGFDVISKPGDGENVPAGAPYDIVWAPGSVTGTVTLSVIGGQTQATLTDKGTIASKVDNSLGKFTWNVPSSLGSDPIYGIKIVLDATPTTFQFSFPFHIVGGGASGGNDTTTTVTSASATVSVTVTLSSGAGSSSTPVTTSTSVYTPPSNISTPAGGALTSTRTVTRAATTAATTTGATVPSNAADVARAGPLALLGGLAIAALAL